MTRIYFNGIKNISSNGSTISFVLDDTYETKNNGIKKDEVIEVITELEAAENIFRYLLYEITAIKNQQTPKPQLGKIQTKSTKSPDTLEENKQKKETRPPVGKKLNTFKSGH